MKSVYDLRDLENWETATRGIFPPVRLGVLGDPVAHSFSPQMQNAALKASGIEMQYARFKISPNELKVVLGQMRELGFVGCNLTVPHKTAAIALVDEVDARARQIGAINTIAFSNQKSLSWNTDGPGFCRAISETFRVELRDLNVLILGAGGGAGRALTWECALAGCPRLILANRDFRKAQNLVREVVGHLARGDDQKECLTAIPWEDRLLAPELTRADLLVHATSLGLNPSDPSPVPARLLRPELMVYDLNYAAHLSPLLRAVEIAGARGANGLTMLLHQGALAFEHWFNQSPSLEAMRTAFQT
jgi:shikimate dehydrogenase